MRLAIFIATLLAWVCSAACAAPRPDVAKQCLRAAYLMYPYQRPGAAPMRSDRLYFFRNCVAKQDAAADSPMDAMPNAGKIEPEH